MPDTVRVPNDLDSFWMPFTASRAFQENPRLINKADGVYYSTIDGKQLFDGTGGLWCCNAGHNHPRIVKAIQDQAAELDFVHSFGQGHPIAFEAAARVVDLAPGLDHVFFTNSGSEAVDTALKIALAYHMANGEGERRILVGREKAYHGINFGGLSVGGIGANKGQFGTLYPSAAHMRHTVLEENRFSRGQPDHGADLADDLQRLCDLHGGHAIAAVIVEPVSGAGGVFPPPKGYLQRLREICDAHGILLIFDEVITGFGRMGTPFAYEAFGVQPDLVTCAKGMTNATVPMGGVLTTSRVREVFRKAPSKVPDLFHGYTYSGHPLAAAACIATLDVYRDDKVFENARDLAEPWADMLHGLADLDAVIDVRSCGIIGAVQLAQQGAVGDAGRAAHAALWDEGLIARPVGDAMCMSPPLVLTQEHIDEIGATLRRVLGNG
ncbi:aminotransferase class III-fold pyridoxal phosphate-dependent enzyme [Thalassorhabdomicrobium marinisediminis]|uniref:Aspartate aminotransferase family protein n=1 Tax=Thalassorhabdomicrobium marinisediminis TaxID=2170577 RepID=A0A2T7FVZ4_9RHOB|nr:aminotransferase class III-fold pyridoxal phosphate-dependent enzyme [Thalassorhabdomicrobium marinisediminis]PVA06332.1 aspartate aminotransferase family protein [Thalassorhabdomicrobium marinisediminis]